eukprot:7391008-Prymnesium_polylepis.1
MTQNASSEVAAANAVPLRLAQCNFVLCTITKHHLPVLPGTVPGTACGGGCGGTLARLLAHERVGRCVHAPDDFGHQLDRLGLVGADDRTVQLSGHVLAEELERRRAALPLGGGGVALAQTLLL